MPDGYDTDEESNAIPFNADVDMGSKTPPPMPAGLVPLDFGGERNDHGEESYYRAKMLARALRRLERWEDGRESHSRSRRRKAERNGGARGGVNGELGPVREDSEDEMDDGDEEERLREQEMEELRREEESDESEDEMDVDGEEVEV